MLTGITDAMLVDAPPLGVAVPAFLEFATGAVLVAHNAPYDVSFLKGACARLGRAWPEHTVVDTARLARAVLLRDEVRQLQAQHPRAPLPARRPCPTTAPCPTRAPRSTSCTR